MNVPTTPPPVPLLHDAPFWESVNEKAMKLQRCSDCAQWRYPAGPLCARCASDNVTWEDVSGGAEIMSWVVFHKTYLPAYPAPHKVIAVRLDEGPIFISNLDGEEPEGSWIGHRVELCYAEMPDGVVLPRFRLTQPASADA